MGFFRIISLDKLKLVKENLNKINRILDFRINLDINKKKKGFVMLVSTISNIPGKNYQVLGLVQGAHIEAVNIGKDIGQSFKNMFGGELKSYSALMDNARKTAVDRMVADAQSKGADAIVGVRFDSPDITGDSASFLVYGTAVKFV